MQEIFMHESDIQDTIINARKADDNWTGIVIERYDGIQELREAKPLEVHDAEIRKLAIEEFATYLCNMMCVERESLGIKYKQGTFSDRDIEHFAKELIGDNA